MRVAAAVLALRSLATKRSNLLQVFLLQIKASLENVAKISLPEGHEYCLDVTLCCGRRLEYRLLQASCARSLHVCLMLSIHTSKQRR